jgi:hypothetical protein
VNSLESTISWNRSWADGEEGCGDGEHGEPQPYAEKGYEKILEYIEDQMEGYEAVYQAIKKEKFYSELIS